MPTFLKMAEVLCCSMAGFFPYLLLLVYPFRNHLRLKGIIAGVLSFALIPLVLYQDTSAALAGASSMPPLLLGLGFLLFAIVSVRTPIWKVLFHGCSIVSLFLLIRSGAANYADAYTLRYLLATAALQAVLLIPYTLALVKWLSPTLNESNAPVWKWLWVIPAAAAAAGMLLANLFPVVLAAVIAAAIATALALHFTKTEMITLTLRKPKPPKATPTAPAVPTADPAKAYFENLQKQMAEAQYSAQELLLQVMSMEDDLNQEDYAQLRTRLNALRNQLTPDAVSTGNAQIDAVVAYYIRQAAFSSIKTAMNLELPELTSIPDEEIATVISCLLDNALGACREQTSGTRRIAAATNIRDDALQIGIKNTHSAPMDKDSANLRLCRKIAARHGGRVEITGMDGVSQIVVTLNI